MAKRSRKSGGCRVVKFPRGKVVRFCRKEATPAQRAAKSRRAKRILKQYACKAKGAPKKACRALRAA